MGVDMGQPPSGGAESVSGRGWGGLSRAWGHRKSARKQLPIQQHSPSNY